MRALELAPASGGFGSPLAPTRCLREVGGGGLPLPQEKRSKLGENTRHDLASYPLHESALPALSAGCD